MCRHLFPLEARPHRSAPRESSGVASNPFSFLNTLSTGSPRRARGTAVFSVLGLLALSRGLGYRPKRFDVGNGDVRAAFPRHERYTRVELLCQGVDDAGS